MGIYFFGFVKVLFLKVPSPFLCMLVHLHEQAYTIHFILSCTPPTPNYKQMIFGGELSSTLLPGHGCDGSVSRVANFPVTIC